MWGALELRVSPMAQHYAVGLGTHPRDAPGHELLPDYGEHLHDLYEFLLDYVLFLQELWMESLAFLIRDKISRKYLICIVYNIV
jgi:hypothetical protein